MGYPRSQLVVSGTSGTYHCVARCVRRAFLCGEDALTGRCFDHRKDWIEARLLELAGIFSLSVLAYAVMSNHVHVVVRVDPEHAASWSDEEVAQRWVRKPAGARRGC
jgi:REP element-mobilizing transposase RayT